jgi:YNFM family putative membrane transporter
MRWWMPTRAEFATATEPADATATADALTRPLRLLSLAGFASMASMRWCDALLPLLAAEFGSSTGQAAQTVAAFAIAYGLMQLVYGPLGDRHGKFTVVSWATLACTAGAIACAVAPGLGWLTAARALNGAAAAAVIPLTMAWIGDRVPMDQRQAVLARMLSATVLGMIAGQWLAGVFADTLGWRAGFVLLALAFGAAGLAMRRFARTAPPLADAAPLPMFQQMRAVLALPAARWLYTVAAVEGALAVGAVTFVPSLLQGRFGLSASAAGAVLMGYGLGGLLYTRAAPWMLRRASSATVAGIGHGAAVAVVAGAGRAARLARRAAAVWRCRPGLLHAAQRAADHGHADCACRARHGCFALCQRVVLRAVHRRVGLVLGGGPQRAGRGLVGGRAFAALGGLGLCGRHAVAA